MRLEVARFHGKRNVVYHIQISFKVEEKKTSALFQ